MNGGIVIDRLKDKELREKWHGKLAPIYASLKKLSDLRLSGEDPAGLLYLEAAMEFIEARDDERIFFWDTFVRTSADEPTIKYTAPKK